MEKGKKKKILLWSLAAAGGVILFLVTAGSIAYSTVKGKLFEKPRSFHTPALTAKDFSPLNTAGQKITNAFAVRNGKLPQEATLDLTEKETNALLHFASQFTSMKTKDGHIRSRFHWRKGRLCVEASYIYKNLPKGKNALNVDFEAVPYISGGKIKLQLLSLKAGSIHTPASFLGPAANHLVARLENHPGVIRYSKCVRSLSVTEKGGVNLVMDTNELMRLAGKIPRIR